MNIDHEFKGLAQNYSKMGVLDDAGICYISMILVKMKKWLFTLLLLIAFPLMASHIVGGEFELIHISGTQYRLNMILYFDKINGTPGAKDYSVSVYIYRKSDDLLIQNVILPLTDSSDVGYSQPKCSHGELKTKKLIYTSLITLPPSLYGDPGGYYVVWQRCCRNYGIDNIYSHNPNSNVFDGLYAGQTFYLEFPAVVKNGQSFYNSSPRLFPPLNDYASPYTPYYVDFRGIDDDGDSLAYTMVTPLNTVSPSPLPPASSRPYPDIFWQNGFSLNNIIGGHPDLRISTDGLLTCTPIYTGLYVFAVKIEQFRNKEKIGESRRDFQMLVTDPPKKYYPPKIVGKKLTDATFTYVNNMSVTYDNTVTDGNRCIQVQVSDPDSQSPPNYSEFVGIRVVPLNFSKNTDINGILPAVTTDSLRHGSTRNFTICFPQCPYFNGPLEIGIIAYDDACSLPLTDTLIVVVNIQPPLNTPPYFTTATPVNAVLNEGDQATWPFNALDNEQDSMIVSLITDGFVLADAGMTFSITTNQKGKVSGQIHWDAYCNIYDFTKRTSFQVKVLVNDIDRCNSDSPVAAVYNLSVKLPGVANPFIDTDLTSDPHEHLVPGLVRHVNESLSFNVTGTQADNDFIKLRENGPGLLVNNASFPPTSGNGSVASHFQWDITCDNVNLKKQDTFEYQFVVIDTANWCRFIKTDTVTVIVKVLPPDNIKPELVIESQNELALPNNTLSITLGEPIFLNLLGMDANVNPGKDSLTLKLISEAGNVDPVGYSFTTATGLGNVVSSFIWTPDCSIFKDHVYQNEYTFKFNVLDNRCFNIKGDTVTLHVNIKDVENTGKEFLPGNIITPNGDGCNDYFAVEGIDSNNPVCNTPDADQVVSLPVDNCAGRFQIVRIHNRWGKQVFESNQRNFRWYAQNESSGVYYYVIEFSNSEYKGVITVRP